MVTEAYLLLVVITAALLILTWLIWLRTRAAGFVVGFGLLYYWSIFGAWELIGSLSHGGKSARYQYLFAKMFSVEFGPDYVRAIVYYGLFLIAVAISVLVVAGRRYEGERSGSKFEVSHWRLLGLGVGSLLTAVWVIRGQLVEAIALGISGYAVTAAGSDISPLFTIHQSFNSLAVLPPAIGVPLLFTGKNGRYVVAKRSTRAAFSYAAFVVVLFAYGMVMGNKSELFFGAVASIVFYALNARRLQWVRLALSGVLLVALLGLVDYARTFAVSDLTTGLKSTRAVSAIGDVARSNEAFASHLSMYGAIHYKVPLTWGTSVASLVASAVPRLFWPDRPGTVYEHYASYLGMAEGQGYTLHHATGWYLNFGIAGILLGGMALGCLWGSLYRAFDGFGRFVDAGKLAYTAAAFAFLTGGLPNLVRVGLEGYKTVFIFAMLAPMAIMYSCRVRGNSRWTP